MITADVAYSLIGIWIAYFLYKLPPSYASDPIRKHRKVFYLGALGLCISRMLWSTLILSDVLGVLPLLFNRFAFSLYLTCFSAVLFTWIHFLNLDYHAYFVKNERLLAYIKLFLIFFNVLLYVGSFVAALAYYYYGSNYARREMIFFALATFVIAAMLLISGIKVYCMTRGAQSVRTGQLLLFIATLFGLMFLRTVMMLYHQVTGKYLNDILYNCLSYFVPELVSVFVKMLVFSTAPEPKDEPTASLAVAELDQELEATGKNHVAMFTHRPGTTDSNYLPRDPSSLSTEDALDDPNLRHLNYQYMYLAEDPMMVDELAAEGASLQYRDQVPGAMLPQQVGELPFGYEAMTMPDAQQVLAMEKQYQQRLTPISAAAAAAAAAAAGYVPPTVMGVSYTSMPEAGYEYASPNVAAYLAAAAGANHTAPGTSSDGKQ